MLLYSAVFIVGFIAVSIWSFWLVVRPWPIFLNLKPGDYNLPAEEVILTTKDGLKLSAWFIQQKDGRPDAPAIILLHGYPVEKSDMLDIAARLYHDFSTLLIDMRYFGQSQGHYTTLGFRETYDLAAGLDFLEGRGIKNIGVFGFSLGGGVAILTAVEDRRIKAVASYASFADLRTIGYETYSRLWLLKYPLVEAMIFWGRMFINVDIAGLSPQKAAEKLSIPVLIIHSREDNEIPFRHAEILKSALARNPKAEFYFQEKGLHGEFPSDFEARLIDFFDRAFEI